MHFKSEYVSVLAFLIIIVAAAFVVFATGVFVGITLD